jgi:hypothetical protein
MRISDNWISRIERVVPGKRRNTRDAAEVRTSLRYSEAILRSHRNLRSSALAHSTGLEMLNVVGRRESTQRRIFQWCFRCLLVL